jgi:sarcosine oxidase subunit alpha
MRIAGKGLIDRTKPVSFTFDGKPYQGFKEIGRAHV